MPFSALGTDPNRLLGQRWQISIVPSMGVFLQLDKRRDAAYRENHESLNALVLGGCESHKVAINYPPGTDKNLILDFCALPGTKAEAKRIAKILRQLPLLGPDANWHNVVSRFGQSDIMHFATHGFWDVISGANSFLLLTPSPNKSSERSILSAAEIDDYTTTAELVVLSACQTGLGRPHPDSYIGLPQSFLIAGARSVLVSLWPINDIATVFFMDSFYKKLKKGATPAEALKKTQQLFQKTPRWQDGFFWAGFQLVGRPFYKLQNDSMGNQFEGPIFCGGDIIWVDGTFGESLQLNNYLEFEQKSNEWGIIDNERINKFKK